MAALIGVRARTLSMALAGSVYKIRAAGFELRNACYSALRNDAHAP